MYKICFLSAVVLLLLVNQSKAQSIFVDAIKGHDEAKGSITDPFSSLEKAVALASGLLGNEPVTIKVYPGVYLLKHELLIRTTKVTNDTISYTIQAAVMPDDPDWQPGSMPVIQSVSPDNSTTQFTHSVGLLVAKNNVTIKGLKFLGNINPSVRYYYPVTRENESLKGLNISQCYFIGEKNSSPIQGAIWAHGADTKIDHCIFYGCKNAMLFFKSIRNISITHSIISHAYEAAVWYAPTDTDLIFRNNIVTDCNFFWLRAENSLPAYTFSNSIIANNKQHMGFFGSQGVIPAEKNNHKEIGIRRTAKVILNEVKTEGIPKDYLNLAKESEGNELGAGVFLTRMPRIGTN